jgi:hypothetical protein
MNGRIHSSIFYRTWLRFSRPSGLLLKYTKNRFFGWEKTGTCKKAFFAKTVNVWFA